MIYFRLPSSPKNTYNHISIDSRTQLPDVFISHSLCNYINNIKEKISTREKEWNVFKKYTNPCEYIHSIVPQKKRAVSKYKPISRSYFKMLEMIREFNLDKPVDSSILRTFHLAEGPGGFIEAICNKRNTQEDEYCGMTIIFDPTDDNVPAWHKTSYFLLKHPNIKLEYGADNTGNLLHIENFEYCVAKYGSQMDLLTADGGFDFSNDFNRQEISIFNLLWGQTCYALCLQKRGGNFVLKIFDIFYEQTVHILYILAAFYEEVNVCKLKTSRVGNSEKYIVCKRFRFDTHDDFYPIIRESFLQIIQEPVCTNLLKDLKGQVKSIDIFAKEPYVETTDSYVWRLLNIKIPRHFTKQLEDVNAIFGQQQIENIHYTISLIDKQPKQDKLDQLAKQNIPKCINWCIEHEVPYNSLATANIFEHGNQGSIRNTPLIYFTPLDI